MKQLALGVRDVERGLGVLNAHPGLWKWVVAPAVITAALVIAMVAGIVHLVAPMHAWLVAHLPDAIAHAASWLLAAAVIVALATGALMLFVPLAGLIAGPFNERLSEHIETALTGRPPAPSSVGDSIHRNLLGIVHGLRRLVVSLANIAIVFAIGFIPVIGTIAAVVVGAWLTARGTAYDCYDAVLSRQSMAYRDKLAFLAHHRQRTFGLGAAVAVMLVVPGLNLVALGLGTAAATVASHALEHDARRALR